MHRGSPLEIGQGKSALAIAAVGSAKQREERGVLRDRYYLALTKRPAYGSKVTGEYTNFGDKWI
jgi:hypothetical protein